MLKTIKKISLASLLPIFVFALAVSVQAAAIPKSTVQSNDDGFGNENNVGATLTKQNGVMIAWTANDNGLEAYKYGSETWTEIEATPAQDSDNISISSTIYFKNYIYIGAENATDGLKIYRHKKKPLTKTWTQVGEDGLGSTNNTKVEDFWKHEGVLYLVTDNGEIYKSEDGENYEQVSLTGLESDEKVTSVRKYTLNDEKVFYLFTDIGNVYTVAVDELETTELSLEKDFGLEVTATGKVRGSLYAALKDTDEGAKLYKKSKSDGTWSQVNEDGFGDGADSPEVTAMTKNFKGSKLTIHVKNETSGLKMLNGHNSSYKTIIENGAGDENNTYIYDFIKFKGKKYFSTHNSETGAQVISVESAVISPTITSPEEDEEISDSSITISGNILSTIINKRLRVRLALIHETEGKVYSETIYLEEDGTFSETVTDLEAGEYTLKAKAVVKGKQKSSLQGKSKGKNKNKGHKYHKSAYTTVNFTVTE